LNVTGFSITDDSLVTLADGSRKKIKDINAGEEVLTLDEKTGKLVPRKVNALLDHGVKPIYEMATEDGRAINTTAEHPYLVVLDSKEECDKYAGDVWNKEADEFDEYCTRWVEVNYLTDGNEIAVPKIKTRQNSIQSSPFNSLSISSAVVYTSTNDCCLRCGSLDQTAAFRVNASARYCESSESDSASKASLRNSLNCETWKNLIFSSTSDCLISNSCVDSVDFDRNSDLCSFISNFTYRGAKKSALRDENKYEAAELGFINESKIFASKTNFIFVYLPINFSLSFGDNSESNLLNAPLLIFLPNSTDQSVNSFSSLDSSLPRNILNLIASEATFDQFSGSFSISLSSLSGNDIVIVFIINNNENGYLNVSKNNSYSVS